jgi:malate dehydrogenase
MKFWENNNDTDGEIISMGVLSDGSYGVPEGLVCIFPVQVSNKKYSIVKDFTLNDLQ